MKLYSYIIVNLILSIITISIIASTASAECREKECMPDSYSFNGRGESEYEAGNVYFYYDSVFNIGSNWFIIFEGRGVEHYFDFNFEFDENLSKEAHLEGGNDMKDEENYIYNNSISFSGSTFSEEVFHKLLFVNITHEEGKSAGSFVLKIHINKPPSEDLVFLWGGMTVFWVAIGAYTLYISNKFRDLSNKLGGYENGPRKKNE
tara:strand:+ start:438 stop:1052 length:615 start_codon:yes stop_codon:yes gene_type:complete